MIYIYTEDSTSGFDFIATIIKRVIQPKTAYCIESLYGAPNCNKFLLNLNAADYTKGDILILYFDESTVNDANLRQAADRLRSKNIPVYIQGFYCFEDAFYSYAPFINQTISFGSMYNMFMDFRACMQDSNKFRAFKEKYSKIYPHINFMGATLETTANIVFSLCTQKTPCVHVSKIQYTSLEDTYKAHTKTKAYYNNQCNKVFAEDAMCVRYNKPTYCERMHNCGACMKGTVSRGLNANLRHFYNNTVLSVPLNIMLTETMVDSGKTLADLLQ